MFRAIPTFFFFLFFSEWTLAIAITGNKFQEVSTIYKSHTDYLSNFVAAQVSHFPAAYHPRKCDEHVIRFRRSN